MSQSKTPQKRPSGDDEQPVTVIRPKTQQDMDKLCELDKAGKLIWLPREPRK